MTEFLLQQKADPNQKDANNEFPLSIAIQNKDLKMIELLFEYGAKVDVSTTPTATMFQASDNTPFAIAKKLDEKRKEKEPSMVEFLDKCASQQKTSTVDFSSKKT